MVEQLFNWAFIRSGEWSDATVFCTLTACLAFMKSAA